jgi:hypothetical protein
MTSVRRWGRMVKIVSTAGLLVWMAGIYLWFEYAATRPRTPNPATGSVYTLNTHGSVVYLTRNEWLRLYGLLGLGLGSIWVAVAIKVFVIKSDR